MSAWSNLGLPLPESDGYGYSIDAGLIRTPFDTAHARQGRKHRANRLSFTASFLLDFDQIGTVETFLDANQNAWFSMPLLSGAGITDRCVRVTDKYTINALGFGTYHLKLTLEQAVGANPIGSSCAHCGIIQLPLNAYSAWGDCGRPGWPLPDVCPHVPDPRFDCEVIRHCATPVWFRAVTPGTYRNTYERIGEGDIVIDGKTSERETYALGFLCEDGRWAWFEDRMYSWFLDRPEDALYCEQYWGILNIMGHAFHSETNCLILDEASGVANYNDWAYFYSNDNYDYVAGEDYVNLMIQFSIQKVNPGAPATFTVRPHIYRCLCSDVPPSGTLTLS